MNEFDRLLQALQLQAAVINDLTNAVNHLAEQVGESNRVMLAVLAGDDKVGTDIEQPVYLDGTRGQT
jgi:hypothetical protein